MIVVERKRRIDASPERVRALLADPTQLARLMPRAERVDVLAQSEQRARIAMLLRLGRLGTQRVEGEARRLNDGIRFIAVQPMQIDMQMVVGGHDAAEITARLGVELPRALGSIARWIPRRLIEQRIGAELEQALDALEAVTRDAPNQREQGGV
jgi:carbon monoxide dehydrogenase subunit G